MKKILMILSCAVFLASCGAEKDEKSKKEETTEKVEASDDNLENDTDSDVEIEIETALIDVEDVNNACDCANAFIMVGNDILITADDMSKEEALKDDIVMAKMDTFEKLEKKCRNDLNVTFDQMKECNAKVETVATDFGDKFQ